MNTNAPINTSNAKPLRLPEHRDAYYGGAWHKPVLSENHIRA
jgi:hypothetical protein